MRLAIRRPVIRFSGARFALPIIVWLAAGCGAIPSPSGLGSAAVTASPSASGVPASPSPTAGSLAARSPQGSGPTVAVDPGLLANVPRQVDGLSLSYDAENTARVAGDPVLVRQASGLAMAIAATPATSGSTDLVVVSVVRVRDASAGEDWFRSWRDSYDQAACAPAGEVTGHAQTTINKRTIFIGSCGGGAFTYHVRLAAGAIVVSALSVGSRRLGEKLIKGIEP